MSQPENEISQDVTRKRVIAAVLAIFLGCLGVHKFFLGLTKQGIITLAVFFLTLGVGAVITSIIGFVEGIIYLAKSNEQFYQDYMVEKQGWF